MRSLFLLLSLLAVVRSSAQPLSTDSLKSNRGHYIFTVFTPSSSAEAPVWGFGSVTLSTHRLTDAADSSEIRLQPLPHATLRTYMTTEAHRGGAAGADEVVRAGQNIVIGDLLHYPCLLSPEQRQLTESYLAIRHGLTLNQTRPVNYLARGASGSYPVWTATEQPQYRHRIIGLGIDEQSGLQRTSSYSVLSPKLLRLSWEEAPTTTTYLLLADDGTPTARASGSRQIQRSWRVETTGTPPPTTLAFDTRQFYDRALPGSTWTLRINTPDNAYQNYSARATIDAKLIFTNVLFPADATVTFSLLADEPAPATEAERFFTGVNISPNPVRVGIPVQLRAATTEAVPLILSTYDSAGRLLEKRRLPAARHHLTEVSFPASGAFTLHLRPRPNHLAANSYTLKVVAQ